MNNLLLLSRGCRAAERVSEYFARKKGLDPRQYREWIEERFGDHRPRCSSCGSVNLRLIKIWSVSAGVLYEAARDPPVPASAVQPQFEFASGSL